jgi:hypothetical protein
MIIDMQRKARGNVTIGMVVWSLLMAADLFMIILLGRKVGTQNLFGLIGFGICVLFGFFLGWQRRSAALFAAPMVSWFFGWFPVLVASMIHWGVIKGFLLGMLFDTFGWVLIAFSEIVLLGAGALVARLFRGGSKDVDVIINVSKD